MKKETIVIAVVSVFAILMAAGLFCYGAAFEARTHTCPEPPAIIIKSCTFTEDEPKEALVHYYDIGNTNKDGDSVTDCGITLTYLNNLPGTPDWSYTAQYTTCPKCQNVRIKTLLDHYHDTVMKAQD